MKFLKNLRHNKRFKSLKINTQEINLNFPQSPLPPQKIETDSKISGPYYGVCQKIGSRASMQDTYTLFQHPTTSMKGFGIFDGHSGSSASTYASSHLLPSVQQFSVASVTEAFKSVDQSFNSQLIGSSGGTTASVLILSEDQLIAANVGDTSIMLVSQQGYCILSEEHNTSNTKEVQRIEMLGGGVFAVGRRLRVQGSIMLTRSIGDKRYKPLLISDPFVCERRIESSDIAVVMASDGMFGHVDCEMVWRYVLENRWKGCKEVSGELARQALENGSKDNVTVLVVDLVEYSMKGSETERVRQVPQTPVAKHKSSFF